MRKLQDLTNQEFGRLRAIERVDNKWRCICSCGKFVSLKTSNLKNAKSCGCLQKTRCHLKFLQLKGKTFGKWKILNGVILEKKGTRIFLECQCECGTLKKINWWDLKDGSTKQCQSCSRKKDIIGQKFGKLTVVSSRGRATNDKPLYLCRCDCGVEKVIRGNHLMQGISKTCGCSIRDFSNNRQYSEEPIYIKCKNCQEKIITHNKTKIFCCSNCSSKFYAQQKRDKNKITLAEKVASQVVETQKG